jgi:acetoin utilization deacetylase AcuC-like enzyme
MMRRGGAGVDVFFPDTPDLPLPPGHRFPASKYRRLRELVLREGLLGAERLRPSPTASRDALLLAHDAAYVDAVLAQRLSPAEEKRIGVPQSAVLVARSLATVGGTLAAARAALRDGFSGQLAGGTHHAHRSFGSGFCVFNDFAVAALALLAEGRVARVATLDLDVHQGDGTAAILADEPRVMTVSVHGANNFPFEKCASALDVGLPDGTGDDDYMTALAGVLPQVLAFRPGLVLYNSGVDALGNDRLGRLAMTHAGLIARDRVVFETFKAAGVPVALGQGGGYAEPIEDTIAAYANTWRVAREVYGF